MANINVDIFTDENDGVGVGNGTSLREAIIAANTNGDAENTIVLPSGTYDLTIVGGSEDAGATGDFDILDDGSGKTLTITGAGADTTIINAGGLDRAFHVLTGATLTISDATITGGITPNLDPFAGDLGGGFLVEGTLNANNVVIDNNQAANGGGIFVNVDANTGVAGVVNINDSTVSNNTVTFDGGGISSLFGGQLTADNITVSGNTAARNAGGIGVAFQGSATISNSTIINNQTLGTVDTSPLPVGVGAGVHINDGTGTITNTLIAGNTAAGSGGGITIGGGDPTGQGGDAPVTVTVTDTVVTGNTADSNADGVGDGGGIAVLNGTANVGNTALLSGAIVGNYDTPNSAGPGDIADNVSGTFNSTGNNLLTEIAGSTGFSSDSNDLFGVGFGTNLTLLNSFAFESGDGVAFDPISGNLFGLQSIITDQATFTNDADVIQITTDGTVVANGGFAFSDTFDASGIDVLADGTLLIASFIEPSIRQYNTDGTLVDGGINFTPSSPLVSVVFDTFTDTIYGTNLFTGEIVQYDQSGNLLSQLDLSTIFPDGVSAQGLAINPSTGNLFVADDAGIPTVTNGNSSIYEISRSGDILSVIDLVDLTGDAAFGDPEGLSFSADGSNLYVVFDDDDPGNIGNSIGVFQVNNNPPSRFVQLDSFTFDDADGVSDSVTPERGLQGDGIIFNPGSGTLFVVRTDDPDGPAGPEPRLQSVLEFNTDGTYIGEFNFDTAAVPVGGTNLPNGNLLIAAVNPLGGGVFDGQLIEVATDGTIPNGGITIDLPDAFNDRAQRGLVVGVAYADKGTDDTADDSLLVVTSRSQEIVEFDLAGNELSSVDLSPYGVTAPQGLAIDPTNGNIFVADEAEDSGGTNKIYEITPISEDLVLRGEPRLGNLVSIIDTNAEFGIDDPEGLSIAPDGTIYAVFDGDDPGVVANQVATFVLRDSLEGIPTLGTVDKFNVAGADTTFALTDFTEKLVDIDPFAGPAFFDPQGDDLASITIVGLPENGTLSLSGANLLIGDEIAAGAIDDLVYTSNATFGGVDTFLVTASDGTTDSLPGNVDVFVSGPRGIQFTLQTTYDFESADGLTFNPTTGTLFAAESLREDAADPNTTTWVLREIDPDTGALISTVVESEDNLEGDAVPDLDITPGIPSEGIQGIAVVEGTGTDRDGNVILLSTRGQAVVEVDPDTGVQVTAAEGGFEFVSPVIFSNNPPSSITGIYHTLDDAGNEVLYAADFRGRQIIQFAKDGSVNDDAAIDLFQTIPEAELQGIVIDPVTGNFLLADDATGNSASIYEVTPNGDLVGVTNLLELGGNDRFADTEGLGINPATRELYVAIDDDLRNPNFNIDAIGDQVAVFSLNDAPTLIGSVDGLPGAFNFNQDNSSLVVNVVNYSGSAVQEVGVFFLDPNGTIDGVAPTDAGFASAALGRTQVLQSLIANSPTGFNQGNLQRVLSNFGAGTQIAFVRVNDGTINEAISGQATDITFSTDDDATITTTPTANGFVLDFDNELSVQVASRQTSDLAVPPGVGLQNNNRLAAIDLRTVNTVSNFSVTLTREAAFDNDVYFYAADDETGAVGGVAPNSDGSYLNAALGALIPGLDPFEVANGETATGSGTLPAGAVLVPLIIVNGTLGDLQDADTTNDPNVFFPFLGANSDGAEHVRILGDNTFGFEDLAGGDNDFQDITVSIQFG